MANIATVVGGGDASQSHFVRERLVWASKPMGLLALALWVLHPATASHADYIHMGLVGFLGGTAYGWILYGGRLRSYMALKAVSQSEMPNRVPQEYYWGSIAQVMYDNK